MRVPRLHVAPPLSAGLTVELDGDAANHITRVLRLRPGASLVLFDGTGAEYSATLLSAGKEGARAQLGVRLAVTPESPLHITLVQGISRGERMDYTLQKAVELGVNLIVPVVTERTVVQLGQERAERRMRHWQGIVINACEQCGRTRLPTLAEPLSLEEWLKKGPDGLGLVLDPRANRTLPQFERNGKVVLLIGPEGGLSAAESGRAAEAGYQGVRLGPRILRTETAALAAMAALQALWGDLGAT